MSNDVNNIQVHDMNCWAVDDWAAFGVSLWHLQSQIKKDPAYISEAIDILDGLRIALPKLPPIMRKYAADVADMVAGLCVDCIRGLADDCHWDARQVAQSHPMAAPDDNPPDDDPPDDLGLPPSWFDDGDDDDDDDPYPTIL